MSVQLSLMVTATFLTYLCTHKPSNVYFICISKHIFIGEDMMGEKKKFHVYFMPKQIFLSQEVWIQFSLRSDRKARGYRRTEKRSGLTEVKVLKASFITFSAAPHP